MREENNFYKVVEEICIRDKRYKADAYEFIMQALYFTQNKLKRKSHVTGKELLEGIRDFAIEEYGPMVITVFKHWGITTTQDFGNIVFNLVKRNLLSKTETDSIEDFKDIYDFRVVFGNVFSNALPRTS